jgi:predicted permease
MLVAGFVLLIVCANVANLMMVRGLERRQQTSLSMALGARPMRMIRQALTESVILSIFGGLAGLAVAFAGTRLILGFAFESSGSIGVGGIPISAAPSWPILLFAFGISLLTGAVFGIAPAWMASQSDPVEALRGANRATRQSGSIPRKTLVILQAALSLVLLSAAGLLTEALRHLEHQDFGFEQDRRSVVLIDPILAGYRPQQLDVLYKRLHDALSSIPGVDSVALSLYSPMSGDSWNSSMFVEGKPAPPPESDNASSWTRITPDFFATLKIPILKGRGITEQDTASSPHVVVVNEAFANKFFKGQDPMGKRFGEDVARASDYQIVGVAKDARYLTYNLEKPPGPFFFPAAAQSLAYTKPGYISTELRSHYLHDVVIAMRPGASVSESQVRQAMAGVDSRLPILRMQTMAAQVADNFGQERLIARLTSLFGALALVLASIGLYGVTAYSVGTRTNEIGVRMALGADRGNVLGMVLRGALALIGFGLALGLPLSLATARFLGSQLHGMNQYDPVILGIAVFALALAASGAALIPAWRASSISPMEALRSN